MNKKIFLEELFDEIRTLSDQYELDEEENDVFVLKPSELNVFSEDVLKTVRKFLDKELVSLEEEEDDDLEADEIDDIFWLVHDDDDELE